MPYLDVSSRLGSVAIFGIAYALGHIGLTIALSSLGLTHDQMGLMGDVNEVLHHAITFLFGLLRSLFEALNRGVTNDHLFRLRRLVFRTLRICLGLCGPCPRAEYSHMLCHRCHGGSDTGVGRSPATLQCKSPLYL